jgi:hypothetical protein
LPGYGLCDSFVEFTVFGRPETSRVGGEPGGKVVRAAGLAMAIMAAIAPAMVWRKAGTYRM